MRRARLHPLTPSPIGEGESDSRSPLSSRERGPGGEVIPRDITCLNSPRSSSLAVRMARSWRESLSRYRGFSRNAWLYLISNTIQAFSAGAIGVVYTLFLNSAGFGLPFIGVTLFVATAGGALAILPASALTRRYEWRTMLLWSDFIGGVAIFLQ